MRLWLLLIASSAIGQIYTPTSGRIDPNTCVPYIIEGSMLRMCNFSLRQEKMHPDARFPEVMLSGLIVNGADHEWARVRLKLVLKGTDEKTGKPYRHECVHQYDRITQRLPRETSCWMPSNSSRPVFLADLDYEIEVLEDYTFPKEADLLEASRRADEEEAKEKLSLARKKLASLKEAERRAAAAQANSLSEAAKKCSSVYHATSTKRVVDLTVNDADAIQACKALGLYRAGAPATAKPALKVQ